MPTLTPEELFLYGCLAYALLVLLVLWVLTVWERRRRRRRKKYRRGS